MSIISDVKRLFQPLSNPVPATPPAGILPQPPPVETPALPWDISLGTAGFPLQERTLTYHNNEVTGECQGRIQALTGSAMVCVFEDLPPWMRSLLVRLSIAAEAGRLTVTLCPTSGSLLTLTAPFTIEEEVSLSSGQLRFRCDAGTDGVRDIHYTVSII